MDAFTSSGNYLGTDRIGRALTDTERDRLGALLRSSGYVAARLVGLRFAFKLTHRIRAAQDLTGRADLRLVRTGWDPNAVPLVNRYCRLVWSEHMNCLRETDVARRAEEAFLREEGITADLRPAAAARGDPLRPGKRDPASPSYEQRLAAQWDEQEEEERAAWSKERVEKLLAFFRAKDDRVNIGWVECKLRGVDDLDAIAAETGFSKEEHYEAQRRRKRAVKGLLGQGEPKA